MKKFDLIVVGSGVGLTILSQAINRGMKCALIEKSKMGGTCLTKGCIPSKVLVYPADQIREAEHAIKIGLNYSKSEIDWEIIGKRMWSQINESEQIDQSLSHAPNLTIYKGEGFFTGKFTMQVRLNATGELSEEFSGNKIVLASGGRTFIPPINNLKEIGYITSESFFGPKFPSKPWKSLVIVGGGIIAAEFAHIFSAMGTQITIIEMLPRIVNTEEPRISEILKNEFQEHMTVLTNTKVIGVKKNGNLKAVQAKNEKTGETVEISAEEIFIAAGRVSNADILQIEKTGIKKNSKGWIEANEFLETNVPNIWVIGDANGLYQFRHKANHDAEILTRNLFGSRGKQPVDYSAVPWAIFTYPQIAHVGLTEIEALQKGHKIYRAIKPYNSVAKGFAMGLENKEFYFKLIVDQNYQILGAHAIGPNAAILIQQVVYLMNAGFTCYDEEIDISGTIPKAANACPEAGSFMPIYKSMVIHPSLNEVVGWALGNLQPVNIQQHGHQH